VTRFDDLPTPYAVVVWGRVLFLDTLDVPAITTFRTQSADRGPEPQCQNAVPGASPSAAPSATPAPRQRRSRPMRLVAHLDDLDLPVAGILVHGRS